MMKTFYPIAFLMLFSAGIAAKPVTGTDQPSPPDALFDHFFGGGLDNPPPVTYTWNGAPADYNLDGLLKYNGSNNDRNILPGNVGIAAPSAIINDQVAR